MIVQTIACSPDVGITHIVYYGYMPGMESFKPNRDNKAAQDEWKEGILVHNQGLHDQEEDGAGNKIDEATGKRINKTPKVDGGYAKLSEREVKRIGKSEDLMGAVPDALPEDPAELAAWIQKEMRRIQQKPDKKQGSKKAA